MGKRLFLLILICLIGVAFNPISLSAFDSVGLTGLDNDGIVETVPIVSESVLESTYLPAQANLASYTRSTPVYVAPSNYISIVGRNIELVSVGTTEIDSGNHVNRFGEKFIYGHNTPGVFGPLSGVNVGNTFSITQNGVTTNYIVNEKITFKKISDEVLLDERTTQEYLMSAVAYRAKGHGLAIMTCAGDSYGNGDASHRLVLFADAI